MTDENKVKWTSQQETAISAGEKQILVSASAGTGKTMVLVERVLQALTRRNDPLEIDQLLVVTFTEAAAAEMRERIGLSLLSMIRRQPSSFLKQQLALLNKASISTLHSFCLDVIRRYFYLLDLDPSFKVTAEMESLLMQGEAWEKVLEDYYNRDNNEHFLQLVDSYGSTTGDEKLGEMVKSIYSFARSQPFPQNWLHRVLEFYEKPQEGDNLKPWLDKLLTFLQEELTFLESLLQGAVDLASFPEGPSRYLDNLEKELDQLKALNLYCQQQDWESLYRVWNDFSFSSLPPVRQGQADDTLKEQVKALREQVKVIFKKHQLSFFQRSLQEFSREMEQVAPFIKTLIELTLAFHESYSGAKKDKALLDFSDLEHYCLALLTEGEGDIFQPSHVALELKGQYRQVLVDEYQDINSVQEAILQLLTAGEAGAPCLFMVGDVKQSIYRFRLAEPALFLEKYYRFSSRGGSFHRSLHLTENFRCRQQVVDGVNFIFKQLFSTSLGGITYDESAALVCGQPYPPLKQGCSMAGPIELHLVERQEEPFTGESGDDLEEGTEKEIIYPQKELSPQEKEARVVTRKIKELVAQKEPALKVWDKEKAMYRPVSYRDMAILLRAPRGKIEAFTEVLRREGIPFYAQQGTGYLASTEIKTMVSLLKIIDNPRQDIPLAAVLRSPIVGFDPEELAAVRRLCPRGNYLDALKIAGTSNLALRTAQKASGFLQKLEEWRTLARRSPVSYLIWQLLRETGYLDYVGGLPQGIQRRADLKAFYHRAYQYDRFATHGLFRFLKFWEKIEDTDSDMGSARALGEKEDVVRIMSVHRSKGLEFPVVFLADLGRKMQGSGKGDDFLVHKDLGLGLRYVHLDYMLKYPTLPYLSLQEVLVREELAEELRVLYVAMTRAREKLILVGSARNLPAKCRSWSRGAFSPGTSLSLPYLRRGNSYLDWLGMALLRHPDAFLLRELAGSLPETGLLEEETSSWRFFLEKSSLPCASSQEEKERKEETEKNEAWEKIKALQPLAREASSTSLQAEIANRLEWQYPYLEYTRKAAKVTVSELKNLWQRQDEPSIMGNTPYVFSSWRQPAFARQQQELTPAQRGSAVHMVLQRFPLDGPGGEAGLQQYLQELTRQGYLSEEEAKVISVKTLANFFASFLGKRMMCNPSRTWREVPFTVRLPAHKVYPELPAAEEYVLLQGIVDCLVEEEKGFLLIDFKTDRAGSEQDLSPYFQQLYLYSCAVQAILKKPVTESWIYFLETGEAVNMQEAK